ncbi:MAG: MaoC/PaaZ C-terminal domain-containing protein [Candidatus Diapherotrites archaeon]
MKTKNFDELRVGKVDSLMQEFTAKEVEAFNNLVGDVNPIHADRDFAGKTAFGRRAVFGVLLVAHIHSRYSRNLKRSFKLIRHDVKFIKPVFLGEKIVFKLECRQGRNNSLSCSSKAETKSGDAVLEESSEIKLMD